MSNEIRIAELISSRICYALAAPVGAIGNGMELIEEFEDSMQDEAVDLISMSATRSTNQIKFFRMAYGSAGYDGLGNPSEVRALAEGFVDTEKFSFDWNFDALAPGESLSPGHGKLLLLMIELASEMLLRDGAIEITYAPEADLCVFARADDATLDSALENAMTSDCDLNEVTARTIHGAYTALVALSAHASPEDFERGRQAGFTDYVAKFDREGLLQTLSQTIGGATE